jgi:transcriptional regulator of acetoin/glycerol metabolism
MTERRKTHQLIGAQIEDVLDLETPLERMRPEASVRLNLQNKTIHAMLTVPETRCEFPALRRPGGTSARSGFTSASSPIGGADFAEKGVWIDPIMSQALDRATRLLKAGLPLMIFGEIGAGKNRFRGDRGEAVFR